MLEVLITMVLLVSWLEFFDGGMEPMDIEVIDFFGGAARLAKASREIGMKAVAFDISYHTDPNVFDINSPAGFAFPCRICYLIVTYQKIPSWNCLMVSGGNA